MDEKVVILEELPEDHYAVKSIQCEDGYVWIIHEDKMGITNAGH